MKRKIVSVVIMLVILVANANAQTPSRSQFLNKPPQSIINSGDYTKVPTKDKSQNGLWYYVKKGTYILWYALYYAPELY